MINWWLEGVLTSWCSVIALLPPQQPWSTALSPTKTGEACPQVVSDLALLEIHLGETNLGLLLPFHRFLTLQPQTIKLCLGPVATGVHTCCILARRPPLPPPPRLLEKEPNNALCVRSKTSEEPQKPTADASPWSPTSKVSCYAKEPVPLAVESVQLWGRR